LLGGVVARTKFALRAVRAVDDCLGRLFLIDGQIGAPATLARRLFAAALDALRAIRFQRLCAPGIRRLKLCLKPHDDGGHGRAKLLNLGSDSETDDLLCCD
jgi:hypothetical protein